MTPKQDAATLVSERRFRVMGGPSVPWRLVEPYRDQAKDNHDQTLEELNRRGGLAPNELWCIVHGKRLRERPGEEQALVWLTAWLDRDSVATVIIERDAAIRERDEARERIDFMRHRYSTVGGRACAICVYENGRFIQACKLHEEFDAYNKAYDTLQTERDEARSERDHLTTELAAARAEVARMRPVYEAAREWMRSRDHVRINRWTAREVVLGSAVQLADAALSADKESSHG